MTRGEADRIANMAYEDDIHRTEAESVVDILVALGVLKLDEPKLVARVYVVAADAMEERGVRCNHVALEDILRTAGLKIVSA